MKPTCITLCQHTTSEWQVRGVAIGGVFRQVRGVAIGGVVRLGADCVELVLYIAVKPSSQ